MWKKIALAVAVLLVALAVVIATRPATFRVSRSTVVAAPAEALYARIADFHAWQAWSPWEGLDPSMKREFAGPASGTGAEYGWSGNDEVGKGRMTVTEARRGERVAIRLEFIEPFASVNETEFALAPAAGGTRVEWTMTGHNDFVGKAFGLFVDVEKMVGADFEKGLAKMKALAEASVAPPAAVPAAATAR